MDMQSFNRRPSHCPSSQNMPYPRSHHEMHANMRLFFAMTLKVAKFPVSKNLRLILSLSQSFSGAP